MVYIGIAARSIVSIAVITCMCVVIGMQIAETMDPERIKDGVVYQK